MKLRDTVRSSVGFVVVDTCKTFEGFWETMVFKATKSGLVRNYIDLDSARYVDESSAVDGHKRMIEKWAV